MPKRATLEAKEVVVVAFRSDSVTEFQVDCNMERTAGSDQEGNVGGKRGAVALVDFKVGKIKRRLPVFGPLWFETKKSSWS